MSILARKADFVQAKQVYDKAKQICTELRKAWQVIELTMAFANLLAAEKRWDQAFDRFQESADMLAPAEARFPRALFLQDWAQGHLERGQEGDTKRAREIFQEALAEFEDMGSPGYVKRIQAKLDELEGW